jgi:hypothetical protein
VLEFLVKRGTNSQRSFAAGCSAGTTRGSSATGFEIVASSPEAFDERIRHDYAIYGNVAKDAGIKPE